LNVRDAISGKRVLITGGTGTIGREVIRRLLPLDPRVIRVFSRDENKHFHLREQLRKHDNVRFLIGDVRDRERLRMAMQDVDVVFHLAAMKHVEGSEYNPFEAIKTNIVGTQNVVETALEVNVASVVLTSSDKAVNPSNAMGASKLMAEKLMVAANYYKGRRRTVFSGIRFGNVLGSSGSVVPTFLSRIRNGDAIEVTHPEMTRFVTSYSQAVELLLVALMSATGGEIFVRKMPVIRILDLAELLAEEMAGLYGREGVPIRVTGVRAGEKIAEELFTVEESTRTVEIGDYYVVKPQIGVPGAIDAAAAAVAVRSYSSADQTPLTKAEMLSLFYQDHVFTRHHGVGEAQGGEFEISPQFARQPDIPWSEARA
jgi:FlaA1/EpsC-like NDP-sugar epimerase